MHSIRCFDRHNTSEPSRNKGQSTIQARQRTARLIYSFRNAAGGSTRVARRAARKQAATPPGRASAARCPGTQCRASPRAGLYILYPPQLPRFEKPGCPPRTPGVYRLGLDRQSNAGPESDFLILLLSSIVGDRLKPDYDNLPEFVNATFKIQ